MHGRFAGGSVCSVFVLLNRTYRGIEAILDASAAKFRTGFSPESSTSGCSIQGQTVCMDECRDRRPAADFTSDSLRSRLKFGGRMNTRNPDFITVDLRGLKAALVSCAQARRESVSVLVRRAVARELGQSESVPQMVVETECPPGRPDHGCSCLDHRRNPHRGNR